MHPIRVAWNEHRETLKLLLRLMIVAWAFGMLAYFIGVMDWGQGGKRALLLAFLLVLVPVFSHWAGATRIATTKLALLILMLVSVGLFSRHLVWFTSNIENPQVNDIATTTVSAAHAIASGKNPYTEPIDPQPKMRKGDLTFDGYKYLPVMPLAYLPLTAFWDNQGILATNLIADLLIMLLIFQLGRTIGHSGVGLYACLLYLAVAFVPLELFSAGVTDLIPIVFLMLGLLCSQRRSGLSGFWVGLSVSAKLLPGLLFLPCCLPPEHRGRYLLGVICGCIPILVILLLSPQELYSNIVLFNLFRPADSTSWLFGMPPWLASSVRYAFMVFFLALCAFAWFRKTTLSVRLCLALLCILGITLSGPTCHRNYQLWWLPFYVVLIAMVSFAKFSFVRASSIVEPGES
jgi:hypothetical protein